MDKAKIERDLLVAKNHVSFGQRHIARQLKIITALEQDGHAAQVELALQVLETMRQCQVKHEAHRDKLLQPLRQAG